MYIIYVSFCVDLITISVANKMIKKIVINTTLLILEFFVCVW